MTAFSWCLLILSCKWLNLVARSEELTLHLSLFSYFECSIMCPESGDYTLACSKWNPSAWTFVIGEGTKCTVTQACIVSLSLELELQPQPDTPSLSLCPVPCVCVCVCVCTRVRCEVQMEPSKTSEFKLQGRGCERRHKWRLVIESTSERVSGLTSFTWMDSRHFARLLH